MLALLFFTLVSLFFFHHFFRHCSSFYFSTTRGEKTSTFLKKVCVCVCVFWQWSLLNQTTQPDYSTRQLNPTTQPVYCHNEMFFFTSLSPFGPLRPSNTQYGQSRKKKQPKIWKKRKKKKKPDHNIVIRCTWWIRVFSVSFFFMKQKKLDSSEF